MHKLHAESSAETDHLDGGLARLWERRVKEAEAKAVFQIADGVDERWISEIVCRL